MSLSSHHREIVKKTVPALREHGQTITKTFYRDLLTAHPELNHVFNPANQRDGGQANSLAAAVLTYAEHIDQPEQLGGMLQRITNKHSSLAVKPEHYPIVGKHLLGAIQNVLGAAATPEIVEAWGAAYNQLAGIMIQHEAALSDRSAAAPGGWRDFKAFRVERKVAESEVITSFYLVPADDALLPAFEPGQYISIKIQPSKAQPLAFPFTQIRQYSISCAPNGRHYRISVRREAAPGQVSNYLHDHVKEGDLLQIHAPLGDFTLNKSDRPVVLLSGGAGITAMLSMLEHLAEQGGDSREVVFLHATRNRAHHAFREHVRALGKRPGIRVGVLYEEVGPDDVEGDHHDLAGRISDEVLRRHLPEREADFYYCGPPGFMTAMEQALDLLNIPRAQRHSEVFGPDPAFAAR
jgi:nitric oxide dioxygenase